MKLLLALINLHVQSTQMVFLTISAQGLSLYVNDVYNDV